MHFCFLQEKPIAETPHERQTLLGDGNSGKAPRSAKRTVAAENRHEHTNNYRGLHHMQR